MNVGDDDDDSNDNNMSCFSYIFIYFPSLHAFRTQVMSRSLVEVHGDRKAKDPTNQEEFPWGGSTKLKPGNLVHSIVHKFFYSL